MMTKQTFMAVCCALAMSACTSMRVTGFVTDERTGEPIGTAGITIGERYVHVDSAGHYTVNARRNWTKMQLVAPGYQSKIVTIDTSKTRYPTVNIQMTPTRIAKAKEADAAP